jgi:hypothetical protein
VSSRCAAKYRGGYHDFKIETFAIWLALRHRRFGG